MKKKIEAQFLANKILNDEIEEKKYYPKWVAKNPTQAHPCQHVKYET
jgi:hypothetical protein